MKKNRLLTYSLLAGLFGIYSCQSVTNETTETDISFEPIEVSYPETKKVEVTDEYFGTEVADPYRWLEDDRSAETEDWVKAQNEVTFNYLEQIPFREDIRQRLEKLWNYERYTTPSKVGDYYYFYKNDGLQQQSVLYRSTEVDGQGEKVLDPNNFSNEGTISLAGTTFSPDGEKMAFSVSVSGSDWREIYVMNMEDLTVMQDTVRYVKFSNIAWTNDGFYYSRYPKPSEEDRLKGRNEFHSVFFHKLGTPQSEDRLVFEDKEHPLRTTTAYVTDDERFLIVSSSEGTSGNNLRIKDLTKENAPWVQVVDDFENDHYVVGNNGDNLMLLTTREAPNKRLVNFTLDNPEEWKNLIPEQEKLLQSVNAIGDKLFAVFLEDAHSAVYQYDSEGNMEKQVELPGLGVVSGFGGDKEDTETFYTFSSFTVPFEIYRYDLGTGESSMLRKADLDFDADKFVTKQVFYTSKDGKKVPMFIVHKKGLQLDGTNPTWLYGYGGFDISVTPRYSTSTLVWLENGGVYAQANLRGGGEYGQEWHEGGMKLNKQNVFDDFISAAEYLVEENYTNKDKLAINGRSNGGLLIGATMTQRPDLFKVAFPAVGVLDMLRYHKFTIGWAWATEYGASDDSTQFANLFKYSPLHNLEEGVAYPATMITTADHDDRVVPAHSFKFAATLQEKHEGENPVLIRITTDAGHGAGTPTSKLIEEAADMLSFAWYNMEVAPSLNDNSENPETTE
ncbi:prolyl oligopeptidase family protein [Roseivirga sp. BDSF3-8]|uniref:prolyl oligopeptidase family serine peptidase n=1 Tax=Roseivirga sp. BDSF3-8 TaxID=3241598 RepID=UPI003531D629